MKKKHISYKLQDKIHINFALGERKTVYILPQFVFVGETQDTDVLYILLKSNNTTQCDISLFILHQSRDVIAVPKYHK